MSNQGTFLYWSEDEIVLVIDTVETSERIVDAMTYSEAAINAELSLIEWVETAKREGGDRVFLPPLAEA